MKNVYRKRSLRQNVCFIFIPVVIFWFIVGVSAQTDKVDKYDVTDAPPPLKLLTETEQKQLAAASDGKQRTKLALDLMQVRLTNAAAKNVAADFTAMFDELGAFHAIMDEILNYLHRFSENPNARLNNFKRIEIGLRMLTPQIDLLRRNSPPEHERYLFYLSRNVREARSRAIEPQFSNSVVSEARQQDEP